MEHPSYVLGEGKRKGGKEGGREEEKEGGREPERIEKSKIWWGGKEDKRNEEM